jgi:hypothetical protein
MPAATTKEQLTELTSKEFGKLDHLLEGIDERTALAKDDDDTSIKDVVAHRADWIRLFLGWYHDGLAGKTVHFPAEGYKWNELKRYNADLRVRQADLGWEEAHALLRGAHADLSDFLAAHSDEDLYRAPMAGANNDWTPGRWAEAAGPSHYRSAGRYVRRRLRASAS